jgi:hypothetical protein
MSEIKIASVQYVDTKASALQNALDAHTHTMNDITDLSFNNGRIEVDMSDFYTKEEIDAMMNEMVRKWSSTNSQEVN